MSVKFMDNPVYSFWGMYKSCMQNRDLAEKALSGFDDERLHHLAALTPTKEMMKI